MAIALRWLVGASVTTFEDHNHKQIHLLWHLRLDQCAAAVDWQRGCQGWEMSPIPGMSKESRILPTRKLMRSTVRVSFASVSDLSCFRVSSVACRWELVFGDFIVVDLGLFWLGEVKWLIES